MLSAYNKAGSYVLATEIQRGSGPFSCPECQEELILKSGRVKIAHFAHQAGSDCSYAGEAESIAHQNAKLEIYEALRIQPGVTKLQVERYLREVRPDISFCFEGNYVAIELQISPLPLDELIRRTKAYAQKNISVLWTTPLSFELYEQRYAPKDLERNLHTLYDGVVYYWDKGLDLLPVEFEAYMLSPTWYFSSWKEKPSKRFVTPHILPQVSILELSPLRQPRRYPFPATRLWGLPYDDDE